MSVFAVIGGAERVLSLAPSRRRVAAAMASWLDLSALRATYTIESFPTDYDQGQLASCGPNALAENYEFRLGGKWSRLFAYWFTRATEGDYRTDDGVTIPDLLDVAHTMGMPREERWPYEIERYRQAPPREALREAVKHRVSRNDIIPNLDHLLVELNLGRPVLLGFRVPASMQDGASDTATTGIVNVPSDNDPAIGAHAVNAIGFDRPRELVRCTCHYGAAYGDGGTIWLPFAMWRAGMVMDMRAIRSIT